MKISPQSEHQGDYFHWPPIVHVNKSFLTKGLNFQIWNNNIFDNTNHKLYMNIPILYYFYFLRPKSSITNSRQCSGGASWSI